LAKQGRVQPLDATFMAGAYGQPFVN
jgi:hypothetical protein